ncbi:Alpha/Beta hydrolase protein [Microdochium trichocladiopsis]|uniref:Carboxylic ester hydrolase n=1 Tax=Microdochium trichocladiopsis TaxID=1682393 RepID=A0A9P8XYD9_9PEZI|nr:Alpha/Beta hydrolase protein [Microdochium trichocladiopsis]KAH7024360.1 Alpha/Beta hydrolase protein [Microdochium trichocladiopsis]
MLKDVIIELPGHGSLRGSLCGTTAHRFLGVPYALPPTGERRWQRPVPLPEDFVYGRPGEPRDCTQYGGFCPQPDYMMNGTNISAVPGATHSEDCLLLNIWLPDAQPPANKKWPVYVWLHGGWLQMGNPCMTNKTDPWELVDRAGADLDAIVVAVGYRLNIFGFLAGEGVVGNFGFWDQRCALQWIQKHISAFGGDPVRVTLGGLSAGAYSTNAQLQYELRHGNVDQPLFRNIFMVSNAIAVQPKSIQEAEDQLQDVLTTLKIDQSLSRSQQLAELREIPHQDLISAMPSFRLDTFRAVTDEDFVPGGMIEQLRDGTLAKAFQERGMKLVIGEAESEQHMYAAINPPASLEMMQTALENYYPAAISAKVLAKYRDTESDPAKLYGTMTSYLQVRAPIRAFAKSLVDAGVPLSSIYRYRSDFRAACMDKYIAPELGVTHGWDMYVWWYTARFGYSELEKTAIKDWLGRSLHPLIHDQPFDSQCTKIDQYTKFYSDGTIGVVEDDYWSDMIALDELCTRT